MSGSPFAKDMLEDMAQKLEEDGWLGEAEDCRQLADGLEKETSQEDNRG